MATSRRAMVRAKVDGLGGTPSQTAPEDASETFIKGAVLVNNAGYVEEGGVNPTNIIGVADEAAHNSTPVGTNDIAYVPAERNITFEGSIDTSAALGTGAIVATDLWTEYGITEDAAGIWYVDKNKTAGDARVRVVDFRDPIGEVMGRVYFKFSDDATIYNQS